MNPPTHGGNLIWASTLAGCPVSDIIDFSASINPLGPPLETYTILQEAFPLLVHYPDPLGWDFRSTLGHIHHLSPDWIIAGNGVAELLTWVGRSSSFFQSTYLLTPAFNDYYRALKSFNVLLKPCLIDIFDQSIDLNSLIEKKDHSQDVLLLNNPHNPTGKLLQKEQIIPYLSEFGLVIIDEAFMDFLPPGKEQSLIPLIENYSNLIILRSLTKFYSIPGLRLGYAIGHPHLLQQWWQWRDPWSVNQLALKLGEKIVQNRDFSQQTWTWLAQELSFLYDSLAQITGLLPFPSVANFLLIKTQESSLILQEKLLKKYQIYIRDCLSFVELGKDYFRVAVKDRVNNQKLIDALTSEIL